MGPGRDAIPSRRLTISSGSHVLLYESARMFVPKPSRCSIEPIFEAFPLMNGSRMEDDFKRSNAVCELM